MALSPRQLKTIECLLLYPTKIEAAKAAGINNKTLSNYMAQPEFRLAYTKAFSTLIDDATRKVQKTLSPALQVLASIVEDEGESTGNRISAARTLLEYGLRLTEFNDILKLLNED